MPKGNTIPREMPLPKSILCNGCRRTYPEGWRRCPYCKFDPVEAKRSAELSRVTAERDRKRRPQPSSSKRDDPRKPGGRPRPQRAAQQQRASGTEAAGSPTLNPQRQARRDRPVRPRPPQQPSPAKETTTTPVADATPERPIRTEGTAAAPRKRRRRGSRRGRGGAAVSGSESATAVVPTAEVRPENVQHSPRPASAAGVSSDSEMKEGGEAARKRRRRRVRRRRPGEGGNPEQGPSGAPQTE